MTTSEVRAGFPADPASAGQARRFVDVALRGWKCGHLVDVASLLVSELVANAILHAGTTIQVVARVTGDRVRIEVHDDNPRLPVRKHYSSLSATGRGLLLVERLAAAWGSEGTATGKVVWFELEQDPSAGAEDVGFAAFEDLEFDLDELMPGGRHGGRSARGGGSREETGPRLVVLLTSKR
jgi:anti-sigma regulatory factor (Ser/Thr protein kinase)